MVTLACTPQPLDGLCVLVKTCLHIRESVDSLIRMVPTCHCCFTRIAQPVQPYRYAEDDLFKQKKTM